MLNRVELVGAETWSVLSLRPLAVTPELQRSGIGSALVNDALSVANELGEGAVVVLGQASYYPRCGFVQTRELGIEAPWHSQLPDEVSMALPLAN
jgi:predicted N-acetyltransferase YhbS